MVYRVVDKLVYLKVPDVSGHLVLSTFYEGAVVPEGIDADNLKHHLDNGQVVEEKAPEPAPTHSRTKKSE
jgi:hypothetical protein